MASSSKSTTNQPIRSISLPSRSHPSTLRIQEELTHLKNHKNTSQTSLSHLEELYKSMHEVLTLPSTQQVLSQHQNEKWVDEFLDGSLKVLDACSKIIDLVSQMKENIGDIESCLRRRKGDSTIQSSVAKFTSFRKKISKDAKKLIGTLKQMDSETACLEILNNHDHHVSSLIRVIQEVNSTSISMFRSLLMSLSVPISKPNKTKWSTVSNFMRKDRVSCVQVIDSNELECVDISLSTLCKNGASKIEEIQIARSRLEALENRVEEFDNGLGNIFRQLIRTRASLLNIFSF